ncbi:MAG: Rieske 2Fe-2S domain-containing protein [Candidatus Rokubacteria bacterium]|nr:Rieske 2Fe-2S domain-containing protein [Candidatus Rokubacteria bacterium]
MAFVRAASTNDIPAGHGALLDVKGVMVALFNAGAGRFHATSPLCPHEDGPLAEGWLEGDAVVCPWHGFDFDLANGRCRVDEGLTIAVYAVRVVGDDVEIDLP